MKLDIGVWLPITGRSEPLGAESIDFNIFREQAQAADRFGFDSIWVSDHIINPMSSSRPAIKHRPILESWTTLSALSTITSKVKLGHLVLCNPFRHPSLLAKMAATLDVISEGRFILGIGAGWFRREAEAYGIPWPRYHERIAALEEAIQVIKKLWTEGEASFTGKYFKLVDAVLEPKPIQKPHPPIMIGGSSKKVQRLVEKEGDIWDIVLPDKRLSNLEKFINSFWDHLGSGRDASELEISVSALAFLMRDKEKALEHLRSYVNPLETSVEEFADPNLVGPPEDIIEKLDRYMGMGVKSIKILFVNGLEGIELFGNEVLPQI